MSHYVNTASCTLPPANSCRSAPCSPEDEGDLPQSALLCGSRGSWDEDLVKRADLDSAVAVPRTDMYRALRSHQGVASSRRWGQFGSSRSEAGVRLTLMRTNSAAGPGAAPEPAAGVFTRGLRAIAAFRRFHPRTG